MASVVAPAGRRAPGLWDAIRSEWVKLRTVRSAPWMLGAMVVVGVGVAMLSAHAYSIAGQGLGGCQGATVGGNVVSTGQSSLRASLAGFFPALLIVGILGMEVVTAEYGSGMVRATFSAVPRRYVVVAAKAIVLAVVVYVTSGIMLLVSFLAGQALIGHPCSASFSTQGVTLGLAGGALGLALVGLVSLGIGMVVRKTAGGIGILVAVLLVVPWILAGVFSGTFETHIAKFMPLWQEIAVVMGNTASNTGGASGSTVFFPPWIGLAILAGYTAAVLAIGTILTIRRDV